MKRKGFTMVELLAVIAILAIIMLIAVPIFGGIADQTNQSVYESKIANVKAAAEAYAEESGRTVFDIKTLIEAGKIEADNESGEYRNPVNKLDMKCYVINVRYENLHYYANVHETSECYSNDKLEEMYGAFKIIAYTDENKSDTLVPVSDIWYNTPVYIGYGLTNSDYYKNLTVAKVVWQGDRSLSCSKDEGNLIDCDFYGGAAFGTSGGISNMKVGLEVTFRNEAGAEFISKTSKVIAVDMEGPRVVSVVAGLGNTNQSGKRVDIEMTDGNGSGLLEYKMVKVASASSPLPICANESGYKPVTQSKMIEYQDNGIYYTCVRDKVGNDNQSTLASSKIEVTGVDYSHVNGKSFKVVSSGESTPLKTKATIVLDGAEDTSKLKMCVSNTGFLKGCSFETYKSNFDWDIVGNADCNNRTVYLSISDAAGNVTNIVSNPYSPVDTVKYDANGGTLVTASDSKKTACYNGTYPLPSAKRTGYTFDGWYTEKNGGTKITSTSKVDFNGLKTLYAHWKVNTYTISYNLDGGAHGSSHPTSATYDKTITINNPTRVGYTFNGWTITGMDATTHIYGTATTKATSLSGRKETIYKNLRATAGRVTFKATWVANKYTIAYNLDGGAFGANHPTSATYNVAVTINNPTRTGYTFNGWTITGMDATTHNYGSATTTATSLSGRKETSYKNLRATAGTVTFKATWKINTYNVTWNGNGGSVTKNGATRVNYNNNVGTLGTASRTGYTFAGWFTAASGGTQINANTKVTGNVTYYAHWNINKYYLDLNGLLDGRASGNIAGYGTADVYINNQLVCNDCTDYYTQWNYGTSYEIKDIKALNGFAYQGVSSGSIKGTIGAGNVAVQLKFAISYKTPSGLKVGDVIYYFLPESKGGDKIKAIVMEVSGGTAKVIPETAVMTYNTTNSNMWKVAEDVLSKAQAYHNPSMSASVSTIGHGQGNDPSTETNSEAHTYVGKRSLIDAQIGQLNTLRNKGFNNFYAKTYYTSCRETERHSCSGNYTLVQDSKKITDAGFMIYYGDDWAHWGSGDYSTNGANVGVGALGGWTTISINFDSSRSSMGYYEVQSTIIPIITLRSDLKFKEGNGTLASPYASFTAADIQKYDNMLAVINQKTEEAVKNTLMSNNVYYGYTHKYITVNGLISMGYLDDSYRIDPRTGSTSFGCNVVRVWLRGYKYSVNGFNGNTNCSSTKWSNNSDAS